MNQTALHTNGHDANGHDSQTDWSNGAKEEAAVPTTSQAKRHPREGMAAWKWPAFKVLLPLIMMLIGYDNSNVANLQAPLYSAFGRIELLPWVAAGLATIFGVVALLTRDLASFLPLKTMYIACQLIMVAAAAVSGAAQDMTTVVVGRTITGLGAGVICVLNLIFLVLLTTPPEFPRTTSLMGAGWTIGLMIGPIVGGAFAENEHATWRWAMYIQLPVLAVTITLSVLSLPEVRLDSKTPLLRRLAQVDFLGFTLLLGLMVILISALTLSGATLAWSSGSAIALWVLTGVFLIAFILQQFFSIATTPDKRIAPIALFKHHSSIIPVAAVIFCTGLVYAIPLYYTPLLLVFTRGHSPIDAAVRLFAYVCPFVVMVILVGILLPKIRIFPPFYIFAGLAIMAGTGVNAFTTPDTPESRILGCLALTGIGAGTLWTHGMNVFQRLISPTHPSAPQLNRDASALNFGAQISGTAIALALAGCIFQNEGYRLLTERLGPLGLYDGAELREALAGVDSRIWQSHGREGADAVALKLAVESITQVIARLNWAAFAGGAVSLGAAALMDWGRLDFGTGEGVEE